MMHSGPTQVGVLDDPGLPKETQVHALFNCINTSFLQYMSKSRNPSLNYLFIYF
jgi:hypothetical protein